MYHVLLKGAAILFVLICLFGWGVGITWLVSHAATSFRGRPMPFAVTHGDDVLSFKIFPTK
jgi:hypothetical protein